jgi:hypothetical protein
MEEVYQLASQQATKMADKEKHHYGKILLSSWLYPGDHVLVKNL